MHAFHLLRADWNRGMRGVHDLDRVLRTRRRRPAVQTPSAMPPSFREQEIPHRAVEHETLSGSRPMRLKNASAQVRSSAETRVCIIVRQSNDMYRPSVFVDGLGTGSPCLSKAALEQSGRPARHATSRGSKANPSSASFRRCECPGASLRMRPVHQNRTRTVYVVKNERRLVRFKQSREACAG